MPPLDQSVDTETEKKLNQLLQDAENYYRVRDLEKAEELYASAMELDLKNEQANYRMGNIAFKAGQYEAAEKYFLNVIEANSRNEKAYYNLAILNLMQSEKYFQFYSATTSPDTDIAAIAELLGYINQFSNPQKSSAPSDASGLDRLVNLIEQRSE